MSTERPEPPVERVLGGRYRLLQRIATGGMATVWLALDERLGRRVAVKVLRHDLADDEAFVARFRREAQLSAGLPTHPHIVSVHDFAETDGELYLVMEYVEGETLRDRLSREGALPVREAVRIFGGLLSALDEAHRTELVHRDVKPENVLLRGQTVKVTDFGLARAVTSSTKTSATGVLMGTVSYLSPEQLDGDRADERSDVYSAGLVLYELLTGQKAFQGDNPMHVAYQHVHGSVPRASDRVSTVPLELDRVIRHATSRDPEDRPFNAGELMAEVRDALRQLSDEELDAVPVLLGGPAAGARQARPSGMPPAPAGGSAAASSAAAASAAASASTAAGASAAGASAARASTTGPEPENARRQPEAESGPAPAQSSRGAESDNGDRPAGEDLDTAVLPTLDPTRAMAVVAPTAVSAEATSAPPAGRRGGHRPADEPPAPLVGKVVDPVPGSPAARHTRRRWPAVLLVLALLLGAGGWYAWTTYGPGGARVVPPVAHLTLADAQSALTRADLTSTVTEAYDETEPAGRVLSGDPAPGSEVRKGAKVSLTVSKGPERYAVPKLDGMQRAAAEAALAQRTLVVGAVSEEFSETVPAGVVIRQDPAPDTQVKRGAAVAIALSKGREPIPVTDYTGSKLADAKAGLEGVKLKVVVADAVNSDTVPEGNVVSQTPAQGTLFAGDTVTLVPSKGPVLVQVPATIGMQKGEAKALLERLGFKVAFDNVLGGLFGTVRDSNPRAGTMARKGSTVTLVIV